jgi:hypothetical protein
MLRLSCGRSKRQAHRGWAAAGVDLTMRETSCFRDSRAHQFQRTLDSLLDHA